MDNGSVFMKKIFALILSMVFIVSLAACGEDEVEISQPPTFQSLTVDGQEPTEAGELVSFPYEKNGEFTLELQFSNPDNVEFNTVLINGTTFRAHRFSNESTSDTLILNLNAGRIPNTTTFEVEQIEYIDEEGVKSVDITENNTYSIFVMSSAPTGEFPSVSALETALEFEVALSDEDETLNASTVELVKEADESVVSAKTIEETYISDTFEGLLSGETYYLRVVADYETDDPQVPSGTITDEVIATSASYTTAEKNAPVASVENDQANETSYAFDIDFTDTSDVLINDSLHLELEQINEGSENTIVETRDVNIEALEDIQFESLFNNNDYTIYIYADYDLNDGEGVREDTLLAQTTFTTPKREIEDIATEAIETSENRLVIGIDASELYSSVVVDSMRIYAVDSETGTTLKSSGLLNEQSTFEITKLYANQTIDIDVEVTYDLEDGQDLRTEVLHEASFTTTSNSAPSATVESVDPMQGGLGFSIDLNDPDETVVPGTLRALIYEDDGSGLELVGTYVLDETLQSFLYEMTIDYDNAYTVELITNYNLRDNTETTEDYELDSSYVSGDVKAKDPVGVFEDITPTNEGAVIEYRILDNDETIISEGIELVIDGETYTRSALESSLEIDTLLSGETYDVTLTITYDLGDGEGEKTLAISETFTTEANETPTLEIDALAPAKESLAAPTFTITDPDSTGTITTINVLKDGSEVSTWNEGEGITGLMSDTAYTLEVIYTYDLNDDSGEQTLTISETFTTNAKEMPSGSITNSVTNQESITFDYAVTDTDGVITAIEYTFEGNTEVLTPLSDTISETGLLSNTTYSVAITVTYDLNDGEGEQTLELIESFTTASKETPTLNIDTLTPTKEGLEAPTFTITDPDSTGAITTITVLKDGSEVSSWNEAEAITGLMSDTAYTLEVVYGYDLNDGEGNQTLTSTQAFTTNVKETPTGSITNGVVDQESIQFDYAVTDTDDVITAIEYTFDGNTEVLTSLSDTISETGLLSDTTYTPTLTISYDLNDGEGEQTLTLEGPFTTDAKTEATSTVDGSTIEPGITQIELSVFDDDQTLVPGTLSASLRNEAGDVLETFSLAAGTQTLSHYAFLYGETLEFEVTADIDLNDGTVQEDVVLASSTLVVPEFVTFDMGEDDITENSFKGTLDLSQLTGTVDFDTVETRISYPSYDDEILADAFISNERVIYDVDGLLADREIKLTVTADYDVGNGTQSGVVFETAFRTVANEAPSGELSNVVFDKADGFIGFDLDVTDSDNVISDGLYATVKLFRENAAGELELYKTMEIPANPGDPENPDEPQFKFEGLTLEYREFYLLEVETDYYLRDARGVHESVSLDTDTVRINVTPDAPTASISNVATAKGEVTFDVNVIDKHETIEVNTLYARLLQGGVEVRRVALDTLSETVTFQELTNNTSYELEIIADADLKEASIREEELLASASFTSSDVSPTATIDATTTDQKGEATIDYTVNDPYDTVLMESFDAVIYHEGLEVNRIALSALSGTVTFTDLNNDSDYTVELVSNLDYAEATIRENVLLTTNTFTTLDATPSSTIATTTDKGEVSVDYTITDPYDTVVPETLDAVLYESGVEVKRIALTSLDDIVTFTEIKSNTEYTVQLESDLDFGETTNRTAETIGSETFDSLDVSPNINYTIDDVTHSRIEFTLNESDPYDVFASISRKIEVYDESGVLKATFSEVNDQTEHVLSGLLADHTYTFRYFAEVNYLDGDGVKELELYNDTVTTDAYTEPTASINAINPDHEEVDFNLALNDPDSPMTDATLDTVEIFKDGTLVNSTTSPSKGSNSFTGLYSNTTYKLVLTYSYDLQDGEGVQTATVEETFSTLTYETPTVTITENILDETSINFDVSLTDNDSRFDTLSAIELVLDGTVVEIIDPTTFSTHDFTDLLSDTTYTIRATYTYDMNDKQGVQEDTKEYTFTTDAYTEPSVSITTSNITKEGVDVTVSLSDPDSLATLEEYVIASTVDAHETLTTGIEDVHSYTTLYSDETYTVTVTYSFDLNDGQGPQTISETITFTTDAYTEPTDEISALEFDGNDLTVDVAPLDDPDNIVSTLTLVLYVDGVENDIITNVTEGSTETFAGVYAPDTEFTVVLTADYDLNESSGAYSDVAFDQSKITSLAQ